MCFSETEYFLINSHVFILNCIVLGQRLLKKVCGNDTGQGGGGGGGGGGRESESPASGSAESSDIKNLVLQNLEAIHSAHQHLLQLWHHKKLKLDQCFQLRLFEQDCEKVCMNKLICSRLCKLQLM